MAICRNDLGFVLDDFMREFNCDPNDREDVCLLITEHVAALSFDSENEIERIRKKLSKRSERKAAHFAEVVKRLRSRPDLRNANELILFLTTYGAKHQEKEKKRRAARTKLKKFFWVKSLFEKRSRKPEFNTDVFPVLLRNMDYHSHREAKADNNSKSSGEYTTKALRNAKLVAANANDSDIYQTPTIKPRVTKFAVSRSTTPSSSSSSGHNFFAARHVPIRTPETPFLTGRAAGPSVVCEEELARHMLMALQGIEGVYIICSGSDHKALILSNTLAVDDILRMQLLRLLTTANNYMKLRHVSQKSTSDRLTRAFLTGLSDVLSSYMSLISMLYTKFMSSQESLTCLDILLTLSGWEMLLPFLLELVTKCENLKGMQIFNTLYSFHSTTTNQFAQQFLQTLLQPMICIFHECLNNWLVNGRLLDSGFEWMIQKKQKKTVEETWANEFKIIDDAVPAIFNHFEGLKEKILVVGKTVALLGHMGLENDDLHERQRIFASVDSMKCYLYISETHRLWNAIKKLSNKISSAVSRNIVKKYDINAHLLAVQKHYLLDDECLALTFYEKLKEEIDGDSIMLKLDSQQASQAFQEAVRLCDSWPREIAQYAKIEATCGLMEEFNDAGSSFVISSPRDQSGSAVMRLNYRAEIPISIVLNKSVMERFEKAFEFVWFLLSTDFELTAALQDHYCFMKNEPIADATFIVNIYTVSFARMSQFLGSLRSYISYNVLSRLQAALFMDIDEVSGDLDGIIEAHNRYLAKLEEGLFLCEETMPLHNSFCALFTIVTDLIEHYTYLRSEMIDTIEARKSFSKRQKDMVIKDFQDTKFFEQEEERIRLEELQQHLEEFYGPRVKTLNAKFVLLVRDILEILSSPPYKLQYADLALQLDLTGFYRQCEI